ncbi:MAG: Holliday junction resolvase RuvX [Chloroflexota bacterium]|nr:Holliday junction resolvase RuvX [Chloroflexota bacterium]
MRILALDVGERRIGTAISDPEGRLAFPSETLFRRTLAEDIQGVLDLARRLQAEGILVGVPLSLSGAVGPQAQMVLAFAEALRQVSPVPVETWDERLTTVEAERLLREAGRQPSRQKAQRDATAAAVLLQAYLDARRRAHPSGGVGGQTPHGLRGGVNNPGG